MNEGPKLAALAASKICHDLVEPMSGIIQGLEMMKEADTGKNADAIALMDSGVMKAWAKLDFFRFAIAGATIEGEGDLGEARETAEKLFNHLKAALKWSAPSIAMPKQAVRVIANLLVIANECVPRGGEVHIMEAAGDVRIVAAGPRAAMKPAVAAALEGAPGPDGLSGQIILPALTGLFARNSGVDILIKESEDRVEITARSIAFRALGAAA